MLLQKTDARLYSAAEFQYELLGPEYHDRIDDVDSVSGEEFGRILNRNDELCRRLGLQYLWSVLVVEDRMVFTSATRSDVNDSTSAHASFFQSHSDPHAFDSARGTPAVPAFSSFKNEWGQGRMVLVPRLDVRGRRYIIGASVQLAELNRLTLRAVITALAATTALFGFIWLIASKLLRWFSSILSDISTATNRIAEGALDEMLPISHVEELQRVCLAFDKMRINLKDRMERLAGIIQGTRAGTWEWNVQSGETVFNERWAEIIGYRLEEISPTSIETWKKFAHPDDLQKSDEQLKMHFRGELDYYDFESRMLHKNGTWVWVLDRGKVVSWTDDGKPLMMLGSHQDITERKVVEEGLRKSEESYRRQFADNSSIMLLINPRDGRLIGANNAATNFYGYEHDQLKMMTINDIRLLLQDSVPRTISAVSEDQKKSCICQHRLADGSIREVEVFSSLVVLSGRPVLHLIIHDITERKNAEMERQKFITLVNSSSEFIGICDLALRPIYVNPAGVRMVGLLDMEAACNVMVQDYFFPDDQRFIMEDFFPRVLREGRGELEIRFRHFQTGKPIWMWHSLFPLHEKSGALVGWATVSRDITERKQDEEEKKILNAQLQHAQKLEALGTLAGGIAHDFNNILGAIIGYAEMIRDDFPPGSPSIHDINQVIQASHRATDLVKQILAFSRQVEHQKIPMQPAVIVKEAINLLRSSLPTTIAIQQTIDPEAGMILADPTQIHQIIMNLSTNAFHAMEVKGGTLCITLQKKVLIHDDLATEPDLQPGTFVEISIRDTGEGILPENRQKIFDPFFTTKEVGKGTGLGLSMVYSIVKNCDGAISCDSRLGEGTEFRILLPVLEGYKIEEKNSMDLVPRGKERILLIDDEEMLAELGQAMLNRLGYHVTTRTNSLDALTTFQNQPEAFDLIITDQTMPGMTGVDLAQRILQTHPNTPIILCTGFSTIISKDKAKSVGIKGFAYKPLAKKEIGKLIRTVLDGRTQRI